jgi:glyoxylase-like metal-dependent hydrolase (beta-lactamase superfamily II)
LATPAAPDQGHGGGSAGRHHLRHPRHTPGHLAVNISSGSEELLLTGDVVVNSAVSFLHPEWPFGFDIDVPLATKTRMAFLERSGRQDASR